MKGPLVANNLRGRTYLVHNKAYYKISWLKTYIYHLLSLINNSNSIEYEYVKFNNTGCSYSYDLFKTLEKAQASCKNDNQCKGVLNDLCDVNEKYYLCSKNSTEKTDNSIESCFFRKVIIGKRLSKHNVMVF